MAAPTQEQKMAGDTQHEFSGTVSVGGDSVPVTITANTVANGTGYSLTLTLPTIQMLSTKEKEDGKWNIR